VKLLNKIVVLAVDMSQKIGIICAGKAGSLADADLNGVSIFEEIKMADAGKLAAKLEAEGADAIIGTAGIAPEIRRHVSVPVVVAYLTNFDVLETLKEVENDLGISGRKIALILHVANEFHPERLYPYIQNQMSFFTYRDGEHLNSIIHMLFEKDFELLVGGPTTMYIARQLGMKAHLMVFGRETMLGALNKAREILALTKKDREQTQRLKTLIDIFPDGIITTDHEGIVTMCNPHALALLNLREQDVLGKKVHQMVADPSWREVYEKGVKQTDILIENNNGKIFSTRQPIFENGHIIGSVGTLQDVAKIEKLEHKYRSLQTLGLTARNKFEGIIGSSVIMQETIKRAKAYAGFDSTVLIEGETGTGKELFVQSIHNASARNQGPFVAINCAALSESLLESELFGYEEGAFTGAKRGGKIGLFELAHKGTIFLDEINQLPLQLQAKVLRVIQEKVVLRLGGERVIPVDVRILAATNENIRGKINTGKFRNDLYYRINVLNLRLPPLRKRKEDIPLLVKHFLHLFSSVYGRQKCDPAELIRMSMNFDWPGNVRELANYVERCAIMREELETPDSQLSHEFWIEKDKEQNYSHDPDSITLHINTLEKMERQIIEETTRRCGGNKMRAAMLLGVSRNTVWKKIRDL
jgi:PAS domain S-box-containing protein